MGQGVFDAIEVSDATGPMQAFRERPRRAAELMRAQIDADEDMGAAWRADL